MAATDWTVMVRDGQSARKYRQPGWVGDMGSSIRAGTLFRIREIVRRHGSVFVRSNRGYWVEFTNSLFTDLRCHPYAHVRIWPAKPANANLSNTPGYNSMKAGQMYAMEGPRGGVYTPRHIQTAV